MNNNKIIKVLKETIKKWRYEYEILDTCLELHKAKFTELLQENAELKAENERLKEEIKYLEEEKKEKIQLLERIIKFLYPNASDDELFTVTFNSEYIDKLNNLHQTLQEIKAIAEICISKDGCFECKYSDDCNIEDAEFPTYDICKLLIQKITKAEEE